MFDLKIHLPPPSEDDTGSASVPQVPGLMRLLLAVDWANRKLKHLLDAALHPLETTESEFFLLWQLRRRNDWGQNELALALSISPAQMSGIVERLRQRGWLEVQRSTTDRRRQHLRLSHLGSSTLQQAVENLLPLSTALEQALPLSQQTILLTQCAILEQLSTVTPASHRGAA